MTEQPPVLARPSTVPYLTRWDRETALTPFVVARPVPGADPMGIGFEDEGPGDRDCFGVLWRRHAIVSAAADRGRPEYGKVHARRQRRCVTRSRCQVCGGPASRTAAGTLWLIEDDPSTWTRDVETMHPPLCLTCAEIAVRECPHLLDGVHAVRVRTPKPFGVMGTFYTFNRELGRFEIEAGETTYERPDRFSVVAHQMIVQLTGCTLIDLQQELRSG